MQIERIKKVIDDFNILSRDIIVDATGIGDPVIEELEKMIGRKVTPFIFGEISKKQIIEKLALWVEQGLIIYPDIPVLFKEMERFGIVKNKETGQYKYRPLSSSTTDCIMALALAIFPIKIHSEASASFNFDYPTYE